MAATALPSSLHAAQVSSTEERVAYDKTTQVLRKPGSFFANITSVVSLRNVVENPPLEEQEGMPTTLLTPNRGHHALFRALEELEGLEKQEAELLLQCPLTSSLTSIVTGDDYSSPRQAVGTLEALCQSIPRRVCQHPFKRNDIVWVCRTCQADETCVLCHNCFTNSNHDGHDVAFYHAQAGGCCDCGDPDAWDPKGFCPHHGPTAGQDHGMPQDLVERVMGVVPATVDWMVQHVAKTAEIGHLRVQKEEDDEDDTQREEDDLVLPDDVTRRKNINDIITNSTEKAETVFSPLAAGSMKYKREDSKETPPIPMITSSPIVKRPTAYTKAERLGMLARKEGGLFLVLKSDDIHSPSQIIDALRSVFGNTSLYTDSILTKLVRAIKQYGQLVVWGTMELLAECNATQRQLWLDGDRVVSSIVGSAMLSRASKLTSHGLFCSILTLEELKSEQRAVAVLQWLTCLARSCDPLCQKVAEAIGPERHLVPLLNADFKLSSRITKHWHSLLLTLLAVPTFKSHLATAYCDTYQSVTSEYARGMGVLERSGYALSVQFLNRVTYVVDLVQRRDLLGKLGASLLETLQVAVEPNKRLDPNHFVMTYRRYSPCISDLKCVLNVKGMPRLFASKQGSFLKDWISALSIGQMMDTQVWREWSQGHVEVEARGWVGAFNASISLGSLFERLLSWDDEDPSPIDDPNSPLSKDLLSCVELTLHVLINGFGKWQESEMATYKPTLNTDEPHKRRPASLPFSTISTKHGSVLAFRALPMSQTTPFSFHLPLQRFVAACLREACLREEGIDDLKFHLAKQLTPLDFNALFWGLMEFPILVLSRAAQVRAGLWRRNGNGLNDQVLNYAEPPFCRAMRDADLLLVQFAMLGRTQNQTTDFRPNSDVGISFLVHLLLHRLGIFEFCGLVKAPNSDINRYLDEAQKGLYEKELNVEENFSDTFSLPWTYSPANDAATRLLLLEEFLHTMVVLCTELPPTPPATKLAHTYQAKQRLRREVIHRLASGPKTHSELAEVHHVLSHWDNVYLSEEGKLVNPDDATGAALGSVLAEVAHRKVSRSKTEPHKWELTSDAWESYDPSFFHISLRSHQTAAESRPPARGTKANYGVVPKAFCPLLLPAHASFSRLRRDITCDATTLAIVYRTLHMHCCDSKQKKEVNDLPGAMAYESEERSETALARAVHLLTLGAFAWKDAVANDSSWREHGGGSIGSLFFDRSDDIPAPTAKEWVSVVMLVNPRNLMGCAWYEGEENCLQLLRRLAVDGGFVGSFIAQDKAVRAGAAWLCDFAAEYNPDAKNIICTKNSVEEEEKTKETEIQKRKRIAKERAMERMKQQAAKFASMMEVDLGDEDDDDATDNDEKSSEPMSPKGPASRKGSSSSPGASPEDDDKMSNASITLEGTESFPVEPMIPARLLSSRPQCIICNDDGTADIRSREKAEDRYKKSRKRRADAGNALAFVGYTQASTVLKGGGGPASSNDFFAVAPVKRFVGGHVALCGHAVHSECWESYLATVSHREDRIIGKRDEFRCPLCQRLSNCLVPFIDVGVDWLECPTCLPVSSNEATSSIKSDDISDSMSLEDHSLNPSMPLPLHTFLSSTPWWISKHNNDVLWDGQCAFLSKTAPKAETNDRATQAPQAQTPVVHAPRRQNVRPLRKKDLYSAWNSMMKTPRYMRRKLKSRSDQNADESMKESDDQGPTSRFPTSTDSAGETVVWRRFMDQVSDITYRADVKRLGEESLHNDFGEFRHYIVEKYAYNMANRFAGKEVSDWPSCVFPYLLTDVQRQELSREKLLSKLMVSIQSFSYSVCCEAYEARRLVRKSIVSTRRVAGLSPEESTLSSILSTFGIDGIVCDGKLVIMPQPSASKDEGTQPFNGRLGRLRYLGLAVMAAAGPLAADLVQLVLSLPLGSSSNEGSANPDEKIYRAPVVYPILFGNVLTHVVAAICASGGRARARSDLLELLWPVPFSSNGSFVPSEGLVPNMDVDTVVQDSDGFVKLGLFARILQVLLGKIDMQGLDNIPGLKTELLVIKSLQRLRSTIDFSAKTLESQWKLACIKMLEMALAKHSNYADLPEHPHVESALSDRLNEGFSLAAEAACSYLADIGIVIQVLIPGITNRCSSTDMNTTNDSTQSGNSLETFEKLRHYFLFEPMNDMLGSDLLTGILSNWYESARQHEKGSQAIGELISGSPAKSVCTKLFRTQGFRTFDWPMDSGSYSTKQYSSSDKSKGDSVTSFVDEPQNDGSIPMEIDSMQTASSELQQQLSPSLVTFRSKKSVQLIGGYASGLLAKANSRPRVAMIPTSYTDLYAELGQLLPDSEQTAVCFICGEVLDAGGKGECTRHSFKCGAGTGMFFLLQECAGLIMHNSKAAYIHSPYVDSHGETPQYRGRPLNLDLVRYDHLHEVWSGHAVRQQVLAERGSSRQIILPDFY